MKKNKSKADVVKNFLAETPKEIEYFIQHTMDISQQISELLETNGISQRELAKKMNKSESEISKWLSGNHNLTLKSISKLEAFFDKQILFTYDMVLEKKEEELGDRFNNIVNSLDEIITTVSSKNTFFLSNGANDLGSKNFSSTKKYGSCKLFPILKDVA